MSEGNVLNLSKQMFYSLCKDTGKLGRGPGIVNIYFLCEMRSFDFMCSKFPAILSIPLSPPSPPPWTIDAEEMTKLVENLSIALRNFFETYRLGYTWPNLSQNSRNTHFIVRRWIIIYFCLYPYSLTFLFYFLKQSKILGIVKEL